MNIANHSEKEAQRDLTNSQIFATMKVLDEIVLEVYIYLYLRDRKRYSKR